MPGIRKKLNKRIAVATPGNWNDWFLIYFTFPSNVIPEAIYNTYHCHLYFCDITHIHTIIKISEQATRKELPCNPINLFQIGKPDAQHKT